MSQRQQKLIEELMAIAIDEETYPIEARKYPRPDDDYHAFKKVMLKYEDALQEPGLPFVLRQYLKASNRSLEIVQDFSELLRRASWGNTIEEISIEACTYALERASPMKNWGLWYRLATGKVSTVFALTTSTEFALDGLNWVLSK